MAEPPVPEVPRPPARAEPSPTQRVSDADRDRTVTWLREHVVEGRLTLDEFSERVTGAFEAVTRADLATCMADLPEAPPGPVAEPVASAEPTKRRWHVAVLSEHTTKGRWRASGRTNAVAVLGGCEMDLRGAEIAGPEVSITALALLGQVTVVVPEGFEVEMQGFSFLGGRDLGLRDVPRVPGSPVIVVRGFSVLGGIEVKSRPNRATRQLGRGARQTRTETILFCELREVIHDAVTTPRRPDDHASRRILQEGQRIVREAGSRHGGLVTVQGDDVTVAFGGAAPALRCAIDVQRALHAVVPPPGHGWIGAYIGVHSGDAVDPEADDLGHTVIMASRLATAAGPSEILVSSLTEQLVQGSGEFRFDGHGERPHTGLERAQPTATLSWVS